MYKPTDKIHTSWNKILSILEKDEKLIELNTTILPNIQYYPNREDIFNVFSMPVQDIKVVILGQDPYPNEGQAIGYAFAVSQESKIPASLRVIEYELFEDLEGFENVKLFNEDNPEWRTLEHWREQGVFLLNTALTVEAKKAGSHLKYWESFIKEIINFISTNTHNCIWLLWGNKAQSYIPYINNTNNVILKAPHPAAELYGGSNKFTGCGHFSMVNTILEKQNKKIINW